ncbi:hypothetical protein SDC9_68651 [bioreactor metagenome]|uniref:Uncharacterized protein n=1 Tax=bioreactor metagenome TaxID=1076179 RepID=A0A644Y108_9ZZZZ
MDILPAEWLQDIVDGICLDRFLEIRKILIAGNDDDRHLRKVFLQIIKKLDAVIFRHIHVRDNKIDGICFQIGEGFLAVARFEGALDS